MANGPQASHPAPIGISNTLPLANGTASAGTAKYVARADHVHPATASTLGVTASTPARAIGTVFQPSTTKATFCNYDIQLSVTNPLLAGSSTAQVQLLSDASNPPMTVRTTASAGSSVGLAVAVALTASNTVPLNYVVPAGHYIKLVATTAGTGTAALGSQTEVTLG